MTYDFDTTQRLLPYGPLADEVRAVLEDKHSGIATAPQRLSMPLSGGGLLLTMPAADRDIAITKLVTVHPQNAARGLSVIHAEVIVMRASTGERLMMLDGRAVTARRTAAVSLVAAKLLATDVAKHGPLLIVGAGAQGQAHLEAFTEWLPGSEVLIYSRTFAHAQALAQHGQSQGVRAQAVPDINAVVPKCGLIMTGTTSVTPVFEDQVRAGTLVIAVGAYSHAMCELPGALVRRSRVVVDTLEGAQHEAGDLSQAGVDWARVEALEAVSDDAPATTRANMRPGTTVFKSVGHALWDLAAARLAVKLSS